MNASGFIRQAQFPLLLAAALACSTFLPQPAHAASAASNPGSLSPTAAPPPANITANKPSLNPQLSISDPKLDVDFLPTPMPAVRRMLEMAQAGPNDHVVDLGSGDGRIPITAALEHNVRSAVGFELDAWFVEQASRSAAAQGVADRVRFVHADIFKTGFAAANIVTMYLMPQLNLKLRPYLLENLAPGTRIVSHSFDMGDWQPDAVDSHLGRGIYMWVIPARVAGTWLLERPDAPPIHMALQQRFQSVTAYAVCDGDRLPVSDVALIGDRIDFSIDGQDYSGLISRDTIRPVREAMWLATRE